MGSTDFISMQLAAPNTAHRIEDLDTPGYRLHQLKGGLKGLWSITVNANGVSLLSFSMAMFISSTMRIITSRLLKNSPFSG